MRERRFVGNWETRRLDLWRREPGVWESLPRHRYLMDDGFRDEC